jgi:hypothetical protein
MRILRTIMDLFYFLLERDSLNTKSYSTYPYNLL